MWSYTLFYIMEIYHFLANGLYRLVLRGRTTKTLYSCSSLSFTLILGFFMFNGLLNSSYEWIHEVIVVLNPNKSGMRVWFCIVWPSCVHRTCLNSQRSTFIPSELISLVIQILSFLESHWDFEIWVPWRSHGVFRFSFSFSSL